MFSNKHNYKYCFSHSKRDFLFSTGSKWGSSPLNCGQLPAVENIEPEWYSVVLG
jgi:hypothetical protein